MQNEFKNFQKSEILASSKTVFNKDFKRLTEPVITPVNPEMLSQKKKIKIKERQSLSKNSENWEKAIDKVGKIDILAKYGIQKKREMKRKVSGPNLNIIESSERLLANRNMVSLEGKQNFPMDQSVERGKFLK